MGEMMRSLKESAPYRFLPALKLEEFSALKSSIERMGVIVPVIEDEHGMIIDGHHRVLACVQLGVNDYPRRTVSGLTEIEKMQLVVGINTNRSTPNKEATRKLIVFLKDKRGLSFQTIAEVFGTYKVHAFREYHRGKKEAS